MVLIPNIVLIKHKPRKGKDTRPFTAEFWGRRGTGPVRKNFAIPNALESKLNRNESAGHASSQLLNPNIVTPSLSFEKNPSTANKIARVIFT